MPRPPRCSQTNLKLYYPLDLASTLPALGLLAAVEQEAQPGTSLRVLDTCAAPGGKLLVIAGRLLGNSCGQVAPRTKGRAKPLLVATDRDQKRFNRLRQNLQIYIPAWAQERVHTNVGDAASPRTLGFPRDRPFDAAIVDAPCSSERERLLKVLHTGSPGSTKVTVGSVSWDAEMVSRNAARQMALLRTALQSVAAGGTVIYSTCALSHIENDAVVSEVLKQVSPLWQCCKGDGNPWEPAALLGLSASSQDVEATECGWRLLPDRGDGWGPIYWSILRSRVG